MVAVGERPLHEGEALVDTSTLDIRTLCRGYSIRLKMDNTAGTFIVCTEAINLHITWEPHPSTCIPNHNRVHRPRCMEVEWLALGNRLTDGSEGVETIDVDSLISRTDMIINSISALDLGPIRFKRREHTLELRRYFEDLTLSPD